jgi:hypothetical protein
MFKIDSADYMMSICGNDALRELSSPGKSGSIFFLSQDDHFMIKTLRKSEVKVHNTLPNASRPSNLNARQRTSQVLILSVNKRIINVHSEQRTSPTSYSSIITATCYMDDTLHAF